MLIAFLARQSGTAIRKTSHRQLAHQTLSRPHLTVKLDFKNRSDKFTFDFNFGNAAPGPPHQYIGEPQQAKQSPQPRNLDPYSRETVKAPSSLGTPIIQGYPSQMATKSAPPVEHTIHL